MPEHESRIDKLKVRAKTPAILAIATITFAGGGANEQVHIDEKQAILAEYETPDGPLTATYEESINRSENVRNALFALSGLSLIGVGVTSSRREKS